MSNPHTAHEPAYVKTLRRNLARTLATGDLDEAATLLNQLKEAAPLARETRGLELEYLVRSGALDDAHRLAHQLCDQFPDSARIRHWAGRAAYRRRAYADAVDAFRESARLASHWRNRHWLGKALTQLGALDEAEAELQAVRNDSPLVERDLAWLYERREQPERALQHIDRYLAERPDDTLAETQRGRLRGRTLPDADIIEEVESLQDLDEPVPETLVPTYIDRLLAAARGPEARAFIETEQDACSSATVRSVAWTCYHHGAWDLALAGFLRVLPEEKGNMKFLAALEKAARQCERVDDVIEAYAQHAPDQRSLYGRIKRLQRHNDS